MTDPFGRAKKLNTLSSARGTNRMVTVCKKCRLTIYVDQPSEWLNDPIGLSHVECPK